MKILVIGASGQVGKNLFMKLKEKGHIVYGTKNNSTEAGDLMGLDIKNSVATKNIITKINPDCVVLAAAMTNVDYCEDHKETAVETNVLGTNNVVKACREVSAKLVFLSTEYIFDGVSGPYKEDAKSNPVSVYGSTKLEGEKLVESLSNYLIVRTTWVFDYGVDDRNFAVRLMTELKKGNTFKVPNDQYSTPTLASNLADVLIELLDKNKKGVYNIAGTTLLSKYDFAVKIADKLGLNKNLIQGIDTKSLGQKAKRPMRAGLDTSKVRKEISGNLLSLDEALDVLKRKVETHE